MKFFLDKFPFSVRTRVWDPRHGNSDNPTIVMEVKLLPFVWVPIRNVTRTLYRLESLRSAQARALNQTNSDYKAELDAVNETIERLGFHTTSVTKYVDGEYKLVSTDELVSLRLSPGKGVVVGDKSPKLVVESLRPPVDPRRPSSSNSSNKQKQNN